MRKNLMFILLFILMLGLVGCNKKDTTVYKVLVPNGTPLIAIGGLLENENFEIDVVNGSDPLQAAFIANEYDMIIAPLNLGAKLYMAKNSKYLFEAVITTNNTYLISDEAYELVDMKNKNVLAYGAGSTPYMALTCFSEYKELDLNITPLNSGVADVAASYLSNVDDYDMYLLAEPNITILKEKNNKEFNTYDISKYLTDEISVLIQACLFVNPNSNISKDVLDEIENNIKALNNDPVDYANQILEYNAYFQNIGSTVLAKSIPNCNITYLHAKDNMNAINEYYTLLNKYYPKVLNGSEPDESFYN